jgi:hypothetical protein
MFLVVLPGRASNVALTSVLFASLLALVPLSSMAVPSVTLAWNASPGTNVAGYHLHCGGLSGNYTNTIDAGSSTTATVSGLTLGATYYFAATAYDSSGLESDFSNEISYTVPAPNAPPTLDALASVTINENAALQFVNLSGISSGSANETQTLTVTATSSNTGLIPNPTVTYTSANTTGSIAFTPVAYAFGSATITVTVNDGGTTSNTVSQSFTVTVNPVNQPPTLNALANMSLNENAPLQAVTLSGISSGAANESQALTVTATSSNTGLIPKPSVAYTSANTTGSISFTPVAYGFGSSTITVTVNDGGATNNIVSRSFIVTVNPVNQPPTLNALPDMVINENAASQVVNLSGISSGAPNESQSLIVNASSSNTGLIPNPTVAYSSPNPAGSISFAPLANAYGSAVITVTVNDGGASNNIVSRSFAVTVDQPPTISAITDRVIAVGTSTPAIPFTIGDPDTSVYSLTLSASSSNLSLVPNANIVLGGYGGYRAVTVTPIAGQAGVATITLTVSDGYATASSAFQLSVRPRPAPPGSLHIAQALP